jgi:hypothetical protein
MEERRRNSDVVHDDPPAGVPRWRKRVTELRRPEGHGDRRPHGVTPDLAAVGGEAGRYVRRDDRSARLVDGAHGAGRTPLERPIEASPEERVDQAVGFGEGAVQVGEAAVARQRFDRKPCLAGACGVDPGIPAIRLGIGQSENPDTHVLRQHPRRGQAVSAVVPGPAHDDGVTPPSEGPAHLGRDPRRRVFHERQRSDPSPDRGVVRGAHLPRVEDRDHAGARTSPASTAAVECG